MKFDKHGLEIDGDRVWLLDADGQRLCDLNDMGSPQNSEKIVR